MPAADTVVQQIPKMPMLPRLGSRIFSCNNVQTASEHCRGTNSCRPFQTELSEVPAGVCYVNKERKQHHSLCKARQEKTRESQTQLQLHYFSKCVLLCFIDPRVRKIRNEASSCLGIFSRTLCFYYVASSPGDN